MRFSIITPSFRSSEWLRLCVASVADQQVELEHIVQDAGSDDGTLDWVLSDSRVKAFVEKDRGMYDAVNRGFARASGEICAYLNCDEQYLPGALSTVDEFFREHSDIDVVFGNVVLTDAEGHYLAHRKMLTPLLYHSWMCQLSTLSCGMFFRTRLVSEQRFLFNPSLRDAGDAEWIVRLLRAGKRMDVLNRFTSVFTFTGSNMSASANATRERRELFQSAPWHARVLRPAVTARHRLRRLLGGMYSQSPFEYQLYTKRSPQARMTERAGDAKLQMAHQSPHNRSLRDMKPKLLVVMVWQLGDLVISTPFLQEAIKHFDVTLLAKPYARDLQPRFWPEVKVVPFVAPWTAFEGKYHVWKWPWREMLRLRKRLVAERFDFGISARWDPRDHVLLKLADAKTRLGFQRMGSKIFLTAPVARPEPQMHQYDYWRIMGAALGFQLPSRSRLMLPRNKMAGDILVHTGAGQSVRVWPLERYRHLVGRLRASGFSVRVACDPDQRQWWLNAGELEVVTPQTVRQLIDEIDRSAVLIGNDSGPGHLAAFCGVPTFTIFGPQLSDWFAPLHQSSDWMEGKACPYKPCSDYCRFPTPYCMVNSSEEEVCRRVEQFLHSTLPTRLQVAG